MLVFAASAEQATDAYAQAQAQVLRDNLTAQRFTGEMTFVDIHTSGTLADLAHTRADLAVISPQGRWPLHWPTFGNKNCQ